MVENVPGAGGIVAANLVAKTSPDGHVLMFGDSGAMAINPALNPNLGYDPIKDFTPITALVTLPTILVVHPDVPAKTLDEFVALAKKQPGKMSFGSAGAGSIHHLTFAIFAERAGIELLHVPYRGGSAMVNGVLTGEIQAGWSGIPNVMELIAAGKLRGLCVSTLQRSPSTPAIPTCDEIGLKGFNVATMMGMHAAAGTSPRIVARLQAEAAKSMREPAMADAHGAARHGDGGERHRELRGVHARRHGALRAGGAEAEPAAAEIDGARRIRLGDGPGTGSPEPRCLAGLDTSRVCDRACPGQGPRSSRSPGSFMWRGDGRVSEPVPMEPGVRGRSLFPEESGMRVECEKSGAALLTFLSRR